MLTATQVPSAYRAVIDEQLAIHNQRPSIQQRNEIPDTKEIPLDDKRHWLRIPNVICVYVDMVNSTGLTTTQDDPTIAGAYQLFTDTAVRLFDTLDAAYIDVRGDGIFALFNEHHPYRALAAAITFRTFVQEAFLPRHEARKIPLGVHTGIDQDTVLVKRLGMRRTSGRTDRQNEVWAGTPVNNAAKLASQTNHPQLLVSPTFFSRIPAQRAQQSCGCPSGTPQPLWTTITLPPHPPLGYASAHRLDAVWCKTHGAEYCDAILALDK